MTRITSIDRTVYIAATIATLGLAAFFTAFWNSMGIPMRLITTLGGGMLLHIMAMMAWQSAQSGNTLTLLLGKCIFFAASILQTVGWFVLLVHWFPTTAQNGHAALFTMLFMAVQDMAIYRQYRITSILIYVCIYIYSFSFILLHLLGANTQIALLVLGFSMLLEAHGLAKTRLHTISPWLVVLGSCLSYVTLFKCTYGGIFEILYLLAIASGALAAMRFHSRTMLWCTAFFTCAYLAYLATAYLLHGPLWSVSLPLLGVAIFTCLRLTHNLQLRYLPST